MLARVRARVPLLSIAVVCATFYLAPLLVWRAASADVTHVRSGSLVYDHE